MRRLPLPAPVLLAAGYAILLFVSGLFLHPIMTFAWSETDNYVGHARMLARGGWPRDVFHPLMFPVCTAGVASVIGDFFVAAKAISAIASGVLIWAVYALARRELGRGCALIAMLAVAVHPYTVQNGFVATDASLSTALCAVTLLVCSHAVRSPAAGWAIAMGFTFAMAYWSRYSAAALLVPTTLTLLFPWNASKMRRLGRALIFAAATCVFLIPHFYLTHAQWGKILYDENWRNLALSVYSNFDWQYLFDPRFDGWGSVIAHDPQALISKGISDVVQIFGTDLPGHLVGRPGEMLTPWAGMVYGLALLGLVGSFLFLRPFLAIMWAFCAAYLTALAITFDTWPRHVFVVAPLLLVSATTIFNVFERLGTGRALRFIQVLLAALLLGFLASPTPKVIREVAERHPFAEYDAINKLVEEYGSDITVYCPNVSWLLANHIDFKPRPYDHMPPPHNRMDVAAYISELDGLARRGEFEFLVFGAHSVGPDSFRDLLQAPLTKTFATLRKTPDVLVLAVRKLAEPPVPASDQLEIRVTPNPFSGGQVQFTIDNRSPAGTTLGLGLMMVAGRDQTHFFVLPMDTDGGCSFETTIGPLAPGSLTLVPFALTRDGLIRGRELDWTVK